MQTRGPESDVQEQVETPAASELDDAISTFLRNGPHDEWTKQTTRRILEEDAEFLQMLGDR